MSDRLQREVEELLARLETFPPRRSPWARARSAVASPFRGIGRSLEGLRLPQISVRQLLLLGIAVIVIAYVFGDSFASPSLVRLFIIGGIVLFLVAFLLSLRRSAPGGQTPEKRWRGEPMELGGRGTGGRFRSWWGRWRSRR